MKKSLLTALAALGLIAAHQSATASSSLSALIADSAIVRDQLDDNMDRCELAAEAGMGCDSDEAELHLAGPSRLKIIVDKAQKGDSPTAQSMILKLDGKQYFLNGKPSLKVSTGREKVETAKSGRTYKTTTPITVKGIKSMTKNHYSNTWKADMPWAMFFTGGIAIHATTPSHYTELGQRASGGCVRLHYDDAKALYALVLEVGQANTIVEVYDSTQGKAQLMSLEAFEQTQEHMQDI